MLCLIYHYITQRTFDPIVKVDGYCTNSSIFEFDNHTSVEPKTGKVSSFPIFQECNCREHSYHSKRGTVEWKVNRNTVEGTAASFLIIFTAFITASIVLQNIFHEEITAFHKLMINQQIVSMEKEILSIENKILLLKDKL